MVLLVDPLVRCRINPVVAKSASVALAEARADSVTVPDSQRHLHRPVSAASRLTVVTSLVYFHEWVSCCQLALPFPPLIDPKLGAIPLSRSRGGGTYNAVGLEGGGLTSSVNVTVRTVLSRLVSRTRSSFPPSPSLAATSYS